MQDIAFILMEVFCFYLVIHTNNLYTYPLMYPTLFMKNGIKFYFKSLEAAFLKQVLGARAET